MVAPPGAVEHYSGYPIIDPATINPEVDWPGVENAQADWLAERVQHKVASPADLAIQFSGLSTADQVLVAVRSDKTLRWWDGSQWLIVAQATSSSAWSAWNLFWYAVAPDNSVTAISIGDGQVYAAYQKVGRTVHVRWWIQRGTSTPQGVSGAYYTFSLPFTASTFRHAGGVGKWKANDGPTKPCLVEFISVDRVVLTPCDGTSARVGRDTRTTWEAGDILSGQLTYESGA